MTGADDYHLPPEQLKSIFDTDIARDLFDGLHHEDSPVLVLLGGQPGAGKTRATAEVLRTYPHLVTEIVGDDLRAYHPAYMRLLQDRPALMPETTAQASGAWVRMAIDYALEHRHSIIVEGTFRRPELTTSEAHRFHDAGFTTHLGALSVPAAVSRLSTLQRYTDDVRDGGQARWTPLEAHEAGYEGTPRTVAAAEASPDVDRISVYSRSGAAIFDQHRGADGIRGAASAVEIGRMTPMGSASALVWLRDYHNDVAYLRDRNLLDASMLPLLRQLAIDAGTLIPAAHPDPRSRGRRDAMRTLANERHLQNARYRQTRGPRPDASATGPVVGPPDQGPLQGLGR